MTSLPRSEIQFFYARIIDWGAKLSFLLLLVTFVIYLGGLIPSQVSVREVPRYWSLPAQHYLAAARVNPGWSWVKRVNQADYLNYLPIALMAGVTVIGYLALLGKFLWCREILPGLMVFLQLVILVLAVAGVFGTGGP